MRPTSYVKVSVEVLHFTKAQCKAQCIYPLHGICVQINVSCHTTEGVLTVENAIHLTLVPVVEAVCQGLLNLIEDA